MTRQKRRSRTDAQLAVELTVCHEHAHVVGVTIAWWDERVIPSEAVEAITPLVRVMDHPPFVAAFLAGHAGVLLTSPEALSRSLLAVAHLRDDFTTELLDLINETIVEEQKSFRERTKRQLAFDDLNNDNDLH